MTHTSACPAQRPAPLAALLAMAAFLILAPFSAQAATADPPGDPLARAVTNQAAQGQEMDKWQIRADSLSAEHDAEILEAEGGVHLWRGTQTLDADFARYYKATGWVFLKGNVEVHWNNDVLTAEEAEFDLQTGTGWLKNGQIFLSEENMYFMGEHIEKLGPDTYSFKKAKITTCDGRPGSWSLDVDEGELTIEGYAWLWQPVFNVLDKPVFYSPLMVLPAKTKRQSGLLMPEMGTSSRLGFQYNQPIFWAIDDESDATFYENYMSERGFMQGVEYRSTPDSQTKGVWRFDVMYDRDRALTEDDEDSQFKGDDLTRANQTRYWFRSKYDGHLGNPNWKTKLDIDWVSDQNYLREFDSGLQGFDKDDKTFTDEFGRDLDDKDDLTRESALLLTRDWDKVGISAKAQWTRDLNYQNGNREHDKDPTLQRLPELHAYVWKDQFLDTPLEWELDSSAAYFWREYGTKGSRFELHPRVSLPVAFQGVSVIPTLGLRQTIYSVDEYENRDYAPTNGKTASRTIPDLNISAFTEVSKVFDLDAEPLALDEEHAGDSRWVKIRHAVQPRLEYGWRPQISQRKNPYFDDMDRLAGQNELTYSLTNLLDRRRETVSAPTEEGGAAGIATDYLEFLRLRLQQCYDAREASREDERDRYPRRPFSDVMGELALYPEEWLSLNTRAFISPYKGELTEWDQSVSTQWKDRGRVTLGYNYMRSIDEYTRQDQDQIRQYYVILDLTISDRWSTGLVYRSDQATGNELERALYVIYNHQCWTLTLRYSHSSNEERIEWTVGLAGMSF
ncbi:LPS-assembly protein LptD [Desulfocurvus sp. DL9XJH121]